LISLRRIRAWGYRQLPVWSRALFLKKLAGFERCWNLEEEGFTKQGLIREFCRTEGVPVRKLTWRQPEMDSCFDDGFFGSSYRYNSKEFSRLAQKEAGGVVSFWDGLRYRRLWGLHFGGHQKNQIPGFTGWSPAVFRSFFRPNYRRNLKWLLQYLGNGWACRGRLRRQSRKGPER